MDSNHPSQFSNGLLSPPTSNLPTTISLHELILNPSSNSITRQTIDDRLLDMMFAGQRVPFWERPEPSPDFKSYPLRKLSDDELIEFCNSNIANVGDFIEAKSSIAARPGQDVAVETAAVKASTTDIGAGGFHSYVALEDDNLVGKNTAAEELDAILSSSHILVLDEQHAVRARDTSITTVGGALSSESAANVTTTIDNDPGLRFDFFDDPHFLNLPNFGYDEPAPTEPANDELSGTSSSTPSKASFDESTPPSYSSATSIGIDMGNDSQQSKTDIPADPNALTQPQPLYHSPKTIEKAASPQTSNYGNPFSVEEQLFGPFQSFEDFQSTHSSPLVQTTASAADRSNFLSQSVHEPSTAPSAAIPPASGRAQGPTTAPTCTASKVSQPAIATPTLTKPNIEAKKPLWEMSPSELNTFLAEAGIEARPSPPPMLPPSTTHQNQTAPVSNVRLSKMPGLESPHYASTELPVQPYTIPMKGRKRQASLSPSTPDPKCAKIQSQPSYGAQTSHNPYHMPDFSNMGNPFDSNYSWFLKNGPVANAGAPVPGTVNGSGYACAGDQLATATTDPAPASTRPVAPGFSRRLSQNTTTTPAPRFSTPRKATPATPARIFTPTQKGMSSEPSPAARMMYAQIPAPTLPQRQATIPPPTLYTTTSAAPTATTSNAGEPNQWLVICHAPTPTSPARPKATIGISATHWQGIQASAARQGGLVRLKDGMVCRLVDGGKGMICLIPVQGS